MCLFTPGTKMSMMFSRTNGDSTQIYERYNNEDDYSPAPTLKISDNGFHQPISSSDA